MADSQPQQNPNSKGKPSNPSTASNSPTLNPTGMRSPPRSPNLQHKRSISSSSLFNALMGGFGSSNNTANSGGTPTDLPPAQRKPSIVGKISSSLAGSTGGSGGGFFADLRRSSSAATNNSATATGTSNPTTNTTQGGQGNSTPSTTAPTVTASSIPHNITTQAQQVQTPASSAPSSAAASASSYPSAASTPLDTPSSATATIPFTQDVSDYELGTAIGYGSSATAYLATHKPTQRHVAIKMIDLDMFERNQIDELRREIQIMCLCKHPQLLQVYGSFVSGSKLWIVTPFLSGGSCLDIMKTAYPQGLEEVSIATILKQALQGLDYLHKNNLIHRDVKAGNLLMAEDGLVQLADFGVSATLMDNGERRGTRKTFVGTPCWMAPEVMEQSGYDLKADIWSFGITAIELATGHAPFAKYPPIKVLMLTLQNDPPTLDRDNTKHKYSKTFKEMIDSCLQKDPTKRPTAEKLLQHAFFKQAKKKDYLVKTVLNGLPPIQKRAHHKRKHEDTKESTDRVTWDFDEDNASHKEEKDGGDKKDSNAPRRRVMFGGETFDDDDTPKGAVHSIDGDDSKSESSSQQGQGQSSNTSSNSSLNAASKPPIATASSAGAINASSDSQSAQQLLTQSSSSSLPGNQSTTGNAASTSTLERKKSRFIVDSAASALASAANGSSANPLSPPVVASTIPADTGMVSPKLGPRDPSFANASSTNTTLNGGTTEKSEVKKGRFMLEGTLDRSGSVSHKEIKDATGNANSIQSGHHTTMSQGSISSQSSQGISQSQGTPSQPQPMTPSGVFDSSSESQPQQITSQTLVASPTESHAVVQSVIQQNALTTGSTGSSGSGTGTGNGSTERKSRFAIQTHGSASSTDMTPPTLTPSNTNIGSHSHTHSTQPPSAGASSTTGTLERGRRGRFEVTSTHPEEMFGQHRASASAMTNAEKVELALKWNESFKTLLVDVLKGLMSEVPATPMSSSALGHSKNDSMTSLSSLHHGSSSSLTSNNPPNNGTTSQVPSTQDVHRQAPHRRASSIGGEIYVTELEMRIRDLMRENDALKKENETLKRDLEDSKKANA